jgi:hypothetical protein
VQAGAHDAKSGQTAGVVGAEGRSFQSNLPILNNKETFMNYFYKY